MTALVDVCTLAEHLNTSADFVYRAARRGDLPCRRLGTGPRARLRFDVAEVDAALRVNALPEPDPAPVGSLKGLLMVDHFGGGAP